MPVVSIGIFFKQDKMNICVFCSSSNQVKPIFFDEAKALGNAIGTSGNNLVYGGANVGLMNEVALAAKAAQAKVIGIIPELIANHGLSANFIDELIVTKDMAERKTKLREYADAFIALPGGFGTLEEILEVITLKQLGYHNKPVVFINTNGFYNHLEALFQHSFDENFANSAAQTVYTFVDTYEQAMAYISSYQPESRATKWDK